MNINVRSEILDFCQFTSGSKGRQIVLESVLWVLQLIKPRDRSERSPQFERGSWICCAIP
jgi:hypothetical protein